MKAAYLPSLILLTVLAGCGLDKEADTPAAPKTAMTVTTATAHQQTLARILAADGPIEPWQEAIISARVGGLTLTEVKAEVGDRVHKGQVLARFDTRAVRAELAQARASLAEATANAVQAAANRDRTLRMQGRGAVSEQEQQMAQTAADMAEAQRQMAEARVVAQEIRLDDCEVRAADDGIISARSATLGQVAQPGTELFRLIRQERLEWRAQVNARELDQVQPGQIATVELANGVSVDGVVRQMAPSMNDSRLAVVYVDLPADTAVKAGMYASGYIQLGQAESLLVPAEAVVLRDGRSSVFLLGNDDRVVQVPVHTGRRVGKQVEILQGLQPGDLVAVSGAGFLNDGDRVLRAAHQELSAQASASKVVP